jgi:hypothetical protein
MIVPVKPSSLGLSMPSSMPEDCLISIRSADASRLIQPPFPTSLSRLSPGQIAYAASDAVLAYDLWRQLRPKLQAPLGHGQNRWTAYTLQRYAIPSVVRMQNRGLLLDREEHAKQVERWSRELAEARHAYQNATGKTRLPMTTRPVSGWRACCRRASG